VATLKTRAGTRLTGNGFRNSQPKPSGATISPGHDGEEFVEAARPWRGRALRISYRVGEVLYAKARAKAKAKGCTVSQIARQALEEYVGRVGR
jgi:hypothetical protein